MALKMYWGTVQNYPRCEGIEGFCFKYTLKCDTNKQTLYINKLSRDFLLLLFTTQIRKNKKYVLQFRGIKTKKIVMGD